MSSSSSRSSSKQHHVLVGGTGAVGSVIADALTRSGHHVTLLLKPKHAERLERRRYASLSASIAIYDHNKRQETRVLTSACIALATAAVLTLLYNKSLLITASLSSLLFLATFVSLPHSIAPFHVVTAFDVITAPSDIPSACSHLWLCVSSSDLRSHDSGLDSVMSALPAQAVVVTITPAPSDIPFLLSLFPHPSRVLLCLPALLAYQAPLVAEEIPATHDREGDAPQGIARYFPPLLRSAVWGRDEAAASVVALALHNGGMPARAAQSDPRESSAVPIAVLHGLLLALELSSWSLPQLFSPAHASTLHLATTAIHQLLAPSHRVLSRTLLPVVLSRSVFRALLFLALTVLPFDGEAYLVFHGTKVSDQTVRVVLELEDALSKDGADVSAVRQLREKVLRRREEQLERYGAPRDTAANS